MERGKKERGGGGGGRRGEGVRSSNSTEQIL